MAFKEYAYFLRRNEWTLTVGEKTFTFYTDILALRSGRASIKKRYIVISIGSKVAPGIICLDNSQTGVSRIGTQASVQLFQIARKAKMPNRGNNSSHAKY